MNSSKQITDPETPFENVCTCRKCDHGLARDCSKTGCKCCTEENHSMIMNGIEGFVPTDTSGGHGK